MLRILVLSALLALATTVYADPVTFEFEDVEFINGNGTLNGSFTVDFDLETVTGFDVVTTAGDLLLCQSLPMQSCQGAIRPVESTDGTIYDRFDFGDAWDFEGREGSWLGFSNTSSNTRLFLFFLGFIDSGLRSYELANVREFRCPSDNARCARDLRSTPFRSAITGGIVAVPEPGTIALLGIGLLGIGLARRRKQT